MQEQTLQMMMIYLCPRYINVISQSKQHSIQTDFLAALISDTLLIHHQ